MAAGGAGKASAQIHCRGQGVATRGAGCWRHTGPGMRTVGLEPTSRGSLGSRDGPQGPRGLWILSCSKGNRQRAQGDQLGRSGTSR